MNTLPPWLQALQAMQTGAGAPSGQSGMPGFAGMTNPFGMPLNMNLSSMFSQAVGNQAAVTFNQAKLAEFAQYERFRHANPFRYDTERDVFKKLEELRGVSRKNKALSLAIQSLEDHASDLAREFAREPA